VHGVQITGGSKLDPRGVECRFLGYATGRGNYKVQDIASRRVFISRDVIFEEGQPHRTSPSVGENNIPLFDTATADETPLDDNVDNTQATDHEHHDDPGHVDIPTEPNVDIPTEPNQPNIPAHEIRRSSRIS
jgi:hypothetical protein